MEGALENKCFLALFKSRELGVAAAAVLIGAVVPDDGGARGGGVTAGAVAFEGGGVTGLTGSSLPVMGRRTDGSFNAPACSLPQLETAVVSG